MKLPDEILRIIEESDHKALATIGEDGPNVVPLSMTIVDEDKIVVCNCFMDKTTKNLAREGQVAVAFWKGFVGVQVKGRVAYETGGKYFDRYVNWLKEKHPDRALRGILIITPEHAYDLDPKNAGVKLV